MSLDMDMKNEKIELTPYYKAEMELQESIKCTNDSLKYLLDKLDPFMMIDSPKDASQINCEQPTPPSSNANATKRLQTFKNDIKAINGTIYNILSRLEI